MHGPAPGSLIRITEILVVVKRAGLSVTPESEAGTGIPDGSINQRSQSFESQIAGSGTE